MQPHHRRDAQTTPDDAPSARGGGADGGGGAMPGQARLWLVLGAALGLAAVAAGAAGTHWLRGALDAADLRVFETAARFQMYHALALLAAGLLALRLRGRALAAAGALFALGTALFSGSLYALALSGVGAFGAVAPVGGVCLMAGWAALIAAVVAAGRRG